MPWVKVKPAVGWLQHLVQIRDPGIEPAFAYAAAINWVHGLSLLLAGASNDPEGFVRDYEAKHLQKVQPLWPAGSPNKARLSQCLERLYMATNVGNTLDVLNQAAADRLPSILSSAMMAWYYGLYHLGHALLAAIDGSDPQTHARLARLMSDPQKTRFLPSPFSLRALWGTQWNKPALDPASWPSDAAYLRSEPASIDDASRAVGAYVRGTWQWYAERSMKELGAKLGVSNFRSAAARSARDAKLAGLVVGFFHAMYRYRTKANYRDGIFTSYGSEFTGVPTHFIDDLLTVYKAMALSVGSYVCRRIHPRWYKRFVDDVRSRQRDQKASFPSGFDGLAILAVVK